MIQQEKENLNKSIPSYQPTRKSNNVYLCSKKLSNLKYSLSCNGNFNQMHDFNRANDYSSLLNNTDEEVNLQSWSRSSCSMRSHSLSDNELNLISNDFYQALDSTATNAKEENDLTDEINQLRQEISDFRTESHQLKQNLNDLKIQLHNAEETNAQLASDLEVKTREAIDLTKINQEIVFKIGLCENENEQFRKIIEDLRIKETQLKIENSNLNICIRENENQLDKNDDQIAFLSSKCASAEGEIEKINIELIDLKVTFKIGI